MPLKHVKHNTNMRIIKIKLMLFLLPKKIFSLVIT